ncbi:AVN_HP_G0120000.mRNA.1.CDS.1 [Saccharomyces cerevisiae]|nr:AVN_HP_G0120000.mRNA.1.CDS.1 [Saccharomyces cerevisiae]CAI6997097.1 AVN_HP_G0120000.mRNA.1.CDS.1 [Saccharomyces cerevisiae]
MQQSLKRLYTRNSNKCTYTYSSAPNGITGATTFETYTLGQPAGELNEPLLLFLQAVEKDRKVTSASASAIPNTSTKTTTAAAAAAASSNANSRIGIALNTPKFSTSSLSLQPDNGASSLRLTAAAVSTARAAAVHQNNQAFYRNMSSSSPLVSLATNPKSEHEVATTVSKMGAKAQLRGYGAEEEESAEERNKLQVPTFAGVFDDFFESDRDSETRGRRIAFLSTPKYLSLEPREAKTNEIKKFVSDFETLLLPSGIAKIHNEL